MKVHGSPSYTPKAQKVKPSSPPVTQVLTGQTHGPAGATGEMHNIEQEPHTGSDTILQHSPLFLLTKNHRRQENWKPRFKKQSKVSEMV